MLEVLYFVICLKLRMCFHVGSMLLNEVQISLIPDTSLLVFILNAVKAPNPQYSVSDQNN